MGLDMEDLLDKINPYHGDGEVTTSDYVVLFVFCSAMPVVGWLLQMWFDDLARGRPITPDHPDYEKYFVTKNTAVSGERKKNR